MRTAVLSLMSLSLAFAAQAQDKENSVTVLSDGVPVLVLKLPGKADVTPVKGKTVIHTEDMYLHLWIVGGASNVTEGVSRVAEVIKGDVLNFKPSGVTNMTVCGADAKLLAGPGTEADDGDEGNAEVVVFTAGKGRTIVACIHGEGKIDPKEHRAMLAALQTAKAP